MIKVSDSKRNILTIALAVLILLISAALLLMQYRNWQDLETQVEQEELALYEAQANLTQLLQHRQNAEEYEQRLNIANSLMPTDPQEQELIRYLSRLAEDCDLRTANIRLGNRSEGEEYSIMPFDVSLEGSYRNLGRYLTQLRHGERAVRVDNLRLSRGGGADGTTSINVSASAFYYSQD